jgi:hypothetical protein
MLVWSETTYGYELVLISGPTYAVIARVFDPLSFDSIIGRSGKTGFRDIGTSCHRLAAFIKTSCWKQSGLAWLKP